MQPYFQILVLRPIPLLQLVLILRCQVVQVWIVVVMNSQPILVQQVKTPFGKMMWWVVLMEYTFIIFLIQGMGLSVILRVVFPFQPLHEQPVGLDKKRVFIKPIMGLMCGV